LFTILGAFELHQDSQIKVSANPLSPLLFNYYREFQVDDLTILGTERTFKEIDDSAHNLLAQFELTNMVALVPFILGVPCSASHACNELIIQGNEHVVMNNSSDILDQLQVFSLDVFFPGSTGGGPNAGIDFADIISGGITVDASHSGFPVEGSFFESSSPSDLIQITTLVPEPNSAYLILFGLVALCVVQFLVRTGKELVVHF